MCNQLLLHPQQSTPGPLVTMCQTPPSGHRVNHTINLDHVTLAGAANLTLYHSTNRSCCLPIKYCNFSLSCNGSEHYGGVVNSPFNYEVLLN